MNDDFLWIEDDDIQIQNMSDPPLSDVDFKKWLGSGLSLSNKITLEDFLLMQNTCLEISI